VLEHLLFACCLEDAHHDAAEEAFAAVVDTFFDWNEVRVSSVTELAEVMGGLPMPRAAGSRLKRVLQSVFEETYAFDLEEYRKKNLGPTVKWLHGLDGSTNFTVSSVVQSALGGHAIPIDSGVVKALHVVELVSEKDVKACVVPGLERAIAKAKGIEFGSILHQFGADFTANPYSPDVRKVLLEIDPDAKGRLPRRRVRKKSAETRAKKSEAASDTGTAGEAKRPAKSKRGSSKRENASAGASKKPSSSKKKSAAKNAAQTAGRKAAREGDGKEKPAAQGISKRKPR